MKVAAVQHDIVWEDPDANFARLAPMIADAAAEARGWSRSPSSTRPASRSRPRAPPSRPAARARSSSPTRRSRTGVWVGASMPVRDGDRPAVQPLRARRVRRGSGTTTTRSTRSRTATRTSTTPRATGASPSTSTASGSRCSSATTCASPTSGGRPRATPTATWSLRTGRRARREHWRTLPRRTRDREPGLRRGREPGRVRRRARLRRRLRGLRPVRRGARDRGRHRSGRHRGDRVRRRGPRARRQDPRPVPLPPGPPAARGQRHGRRTLARPAAAARESRADGRR